MSENWNNTQEPNQPTTPSAEPSAEPQATPPAAETPTPQTPPYNGWSSDGSYRYVPPRSSGDGTPPPTPPVPPQNTGAPYYNGYVTQPPQPPRPPQKKHNGWLIALAIVCAAAVVLAMVFLGLGLLNGGLSNGNTNGNTGDTDSQTPTSSDNAPVNSDAPTLEISDWDDNDGGLSYKEIVNRNFDSTVVITIYAQTANYNFGESSLVEAGGASGIIMSADGYIITNCHCVIDEETGKKYDRIDVTTYDGKTYEDAQVVGADETTDLAVIKINASGLSVAQFGDSATLAVGDRVAAVGNAAGLAWTSTFGYVSALARDVYDDTGYAIKCLQVDAAINPGNSGGPLLNNQGLVVGINSAKIAATGYEGLGFSIPINEAKVVIDSLVKYGYVKGRVALGIKGQTISSGMYKGFMISEIDKGSSFEGTDAQEGDLIVAVDDIEVTDYGTLRAALAKHKVGDEVTVKLLRSNRNGRVTSYSVKVTLKEQKVAD